MQNVYAKIELVFTAALASELPVAWLKKKGALVLTPRQWQCSDSADLIAHSRFGIAVVITGVGLEHSQKAAQWINRNLNPLFVVNLGIAGIVGSDLPVGTWVSPKQVMDTQSKRLLSLDESFPFSWPKAFNKHRTALLISVEQPLWTVTSEWESYQDTLVDMEAYAQANVFSSTSTSFHVAKLISDHVGCSTRQTIQRIMRQMQEQCQDLFGFLDFGELPDIAVVIPVHNRPKLIIRCVESVLKQTQLPKEIVVVNDGSIDETASVLDKYQNQICIQHYQTSQGVAWARNMGVTLTSASWIAFLDSDDEWQPNKLEAQWHFRRYYPFYEILQSQEIWIRHGKRVNACNHHKKPQGWIWQPSLARCLISPSSVLLKRSLFDAFQGFDENLPVCEDYELWIRISRWYCVGLDPSQSLIKYGGHSDQLSRCYPAMDQYRVYALLKALKSENNLDYRKLIVEITMKKLTILMTGSKKRNNLSDYTRYRQMLDMLSDYY